ncbi:CsgG/HfaB family protein [Aquisalimonas sp.]|uniref:CsgG/HfaB family protein n=1 Tax=unclassified Aquisalimonas TaxID=2644645 RepID=UPI0025BCE0F8|nr:CsgG/HfaB family protein [Aquisalimonas sp.]
MRKGIAVLGAAGAGALFLAGCATTDVSGQHDQNYDFASVERVAVVAVEGADGSEAAQNQVAGMFNESLLRKGYSPVERSQIREVMDEQDFQHSDATTTSGAAELGRILNVDTAIVVNVPQYGDSMSMSAQMIDVDNGAVVWSASGSAASREGLSRRFGQLLGGASGAVAGREVDGTMGAVIGGASGAVAGDMAGEAMTPEQQEQAAELVVELSDNMPDPD